ncbi:MAG: kelch repeat-containing protein [Elusimicrobiota bacterium]
MKKNQILKEVKRETVNGRRKIKNRLLCLLFYLLPFTFYLLPAFTTCLYAGTSTTYTTDIQFNAGQRQDTIVFGSGADAFVNLTNNFYEVTTSPQPPARRWHAMTYNPSKNKVILFAGLSSSGIPLNDTWIYNPQTNQWTQKIPSTTPSARYGHILVSDGTKAFLFGGYDGADYFDDTWEYDFDTDNWTKITTVSSPTARAWSCADCDLINNKIILFGGRKYDTALSSETWIYHIIGSSWTKGSYSPIARTGSAGCYDAETKKFLIFGGETATGYLSDTWVYDYNTNVWSYRNPLTNPSARSDAVIFYDFRNKRTVLFGGKDSSENKADIWFYSYSNNKWSTSPPQTSPSARYGSAITYISSPPSTQKAFLFGGFANNGSQNDSYNYVFRSSGSYTSIYFDTPFSTQLYWQTIQAPLRSGVPANTSLKFQVASSTDNFTYSDFTGWDNTPNTFFEYADSPIPISTPPNLHNNKRYLKLKFFFDTTEPPVSSQLQSITVSFNRTPTQPALNSPTNKFSTNNTTPDFSWYAAADDDNDTLTYKIEIDNDADFSSPVITSSNIATTSYSTTTILSHGKYFWRVCAYDGSEYSLWASTYTLYIDTIPPSAITSISASIGTRNGTINLSWLAPGNDNFSGDIISGNYFIRKATCPILTETDWQNNSTGERSISKSVIIPAELQTFTFDGLSDSTTYYFSVKTQDGTGNVSAISSTSPFCMTNAAPTVTVKSPNGSEIFSATQIIAWTYSDPYPPNDSHIFSIYDSSDGVNFSVLVASGLANITYYLWNTIPVRNSATHKIKIVARDSRGLEGFDISDNSFIISNPNIAPVVNLIQPNGAEKISGDYTISFSVTDDNPADTHNFTIVASTNSGYSYDIKIAENISVTNYVWDTTQFPNSLKYRIKISATDDGMPNLSADDFSNSDFTVNNNNKAPSAPLIVSPLNGSYNTTGTLKFVWQKASDPNPEDLLTYTLYYSTDKFFDDATIVPGITGLEYTPANVKEEMQYYWKVAAVDPFGYSAICNPFSFVVSWSKDDSDDGKVRVEITEGLPAGYYVKVENTPTTDSADFSAAIKNAVSDRLIKYINQQIYKITIYNQNNTPQNITIKGSVRFNYLDENTDGYMDNTDIRTDKIRIAVLNDTKNRWEFPKTAQIIDKTQKYLKVDVEHFSYFTIVASVTPTKKISNIVNYPNPFNPEKETTTIKYVLTESDDILVQIFNLVGDLVYRQKIHSNEEGAIGQPEGYTNEITWNGKNGDGITVANGVYIMEIKSGNEKEIRKIAVVK